MTPAIGAGVSQPMCSCDNPSNSSASERDTGPPEMRRPSAKLGRHKVSIDWTTVRICLNAAQLSSALLRAACTAHQAQLTAKGTCSHAASPREA